MESYLKKDFLWGVMLVLLFCSSIAACSKPVKGCSFIIITTNVGAKPLSEVKVKFEDFAFEWGYIKPGSGGEYDDFLVRDPPSQAIVSWRFDDGPRERIIKTPSNCPVVPDGSELELIFEIDGAQATARWNISQSLPNIETEAAFGK